MVTFIGNDNSWNGMGNGMQDVIVRSCPLTGTPESTTDSGRIVPRTGGSRTAGANPSIGSLRRTFSATSRVGHLLCVVVASGLMAPGYLRTAGRTGKKHECGADSEPYRDRAGRPPAPGPIRSQGSSDPLCGVRRPGPACVVVEEHSGLQDAQ